MRPPTIDVEVARLADSQHGVVSLAQLRRLGVSANAATKRARTGRLHRVHHHVYAVGRRNLTRRGAYMAAVLACGDGAILSHRSAAGLLDLQPDRRPKVEVSSKSRCGYRQPGIELHRGKTLGAADATLTHGIPVTTVERTLLDLAGVVDRRRLERAVERAEILRTLDMARVAAVLAHADGRRGVAKLRAVVADLKPRQPTHSELERRMLELCALSALPIPSANTLVDTPSGTIEVDFLWRRHSLVVETDGYETHGTRSQFERDRRRDQLLMLAGYRVVRFTWRQLAGDPRGVASTLHSLLGEEYRGQGNRPERE